MGIAARLLLLSRLSEKMLTNVWPEKVEARFWKKVKKTVRCWEWQAARSSDNYGIYGTGEKTLHGAPRTMSAHRFSYCLTHNLKVLPKGFDVLHSCDNSICVNPAHLRMDTRLANTRDMFSKGRGKPGSRLGVPRAILKAADVLLIRRMHASKLVSLGGLARKYKVTHKTIANIINGLSWRNLGNTLT